MTKHVLPLKTEPDRQALISTAQKCSLGWQVEFRKATRSLEQNAALWAALTDVSTQVDWYGNKLAPDEWKDVFSAALNRTRIVPGIDGGFVMVGARTSKMTVEEMSELLELIHAFGAEKGVQFNDLR